MCRFGAHEWIHRWLTGRCTHRTHRRLGIRKRTLLPWIGKRTLPLANLANLIIRTIHTGPHTQNLAYTTHGTHCSSTPSLSPLLWLPERHHLRPPLGDGGAALGGDLRAVRVGRVIAAGTRRADRRTEVEWRFLVGGVAVLRHLAYWCARCV